MKDLRRRILSFMLAGVLALNMLPASIMPVLAAGTGGGVGVYRV